MTDTETGVDRSLAIVAGCALGATLTGYGGVPPLLVVGASLAGVALGELLSTVGMPRVA